MEYVSGRDLEVTQRMAVCGWIAARRRRSGFTLIEVLIVILVISILAMLVIPRLLSARRKAKETQLSGNLKQLRDAVERFEANTGAWPPALTDVIASGGDAISGDFDGRGGHVDRKSYDGPYMVVQNGSLPVDPFTEASDWTYDNTTGAVHSNSSLTGLNGITYSTW
jgi:prepilin-type N-terminal cleavage/methylation domain-containing protein